MKYNIREYREETLITLSRFKPFKWVGDLSESVKRRKLVTKIFFQIILNEDLKSCEKLYLLMSKLMQNCNVENVANIKLVAVSYKFL